MKSHLRRAISCLGLYGTAGVLAARAQGLARSIRIETRADVYRVRDRAGRVIVLGRRHAIYLSDMVAFFDFFFGAVVPDASGEVHYEKPAWHAVPGYDRPVFFSSFAESRSTLDLYQELVPTRGGDTVIDVGAYCGLTSIDFAQRVGPAGHVYAFEPDPDSFAAFRKNRDSFAVTNLTAEQAAVWKESGFLDFEADGTAGSRVTTVSTRHDSTARVRSVSLGDYVQSRALQRIDLIKIDAEGAETEILQASREVLRRFRPCLIVELHPVHDVMTTEACRKILEDEGYTTRIVPQPGTSCPLLAALPRRDGGG